MKVAIIGSGLSAVSAAEALISRGIKPIILDYGDKLDSNTHAIANRLSQVKPSLWSAEERLAISENNTIADKFPKKLLFGSDYFYGGSLRHNVTKSLGSPLPPNSYAFGGLSVGWGASVLPADRGDLHGWPEEAKNLDQYYTAVLKNKALSAVNDQLSTKFPLYKELDSSIAMTNGNRDFLQHLNNAAIKNPESLIFGQSRLLVESRNTNPKACQYCGNCINGCVYGSIYKAESALESLLSAKLIEYIPNMLVKKLCNSGSRVVVLGLDRLGQKFEIEFDKVLVAAGALNSTRIIMSSNNIFDEKIRLLSTGTYILPIFQKKSIELNWPNINTLPGIFLEYKMGGISTPWIHTQLSTPNELVLSRLNQIFGNFPMGSRIGFNRMMARRLFIALGNLHSNYGNGYILTLSRPDGSGYGDVLTSVREEPYESQAYIKRAISELSKIVWKMGYFAPKIFSSDGTISGGYHVGGSLPMKTNPQKTSDTDIYGVPFGMKNIHVVDSSIFPSIPGTTIGLLSMANAYRIAMNIQLN